MVQDMVGKEVAQDKAAKQLPGLQFGDRAERQRGAFAGEAKLKQQFDGDFGVLPPPVDQYPPSVVRVYAHQHSSKSDGTRADFAETVYWNPVFVVPEGGAQAAFDLSDAVTSYQVLAYAHTTDGRLGAVDITIESRLPLKVEPKVPAEVSMGDRVIIPVTLDNTTDQAKTVDLTVKAEGFKLVAGKEADKVPLTPKQNVRRLIEFEPTLVEGNAHLTFAGTTPDGGDTILRTVKVVPSGFPIVASHSDMLEKVAQTKVTLPPEWIKGTLQCRVDVYPSTLADLQKGLEAMLREPCGCFEQTSTSNYPNLLILDYLRTSDQAKPEIEKNALALLDRGYQKLVSFECQDPKGSQREGYEWFGGTAPPHEALTAYGLMQFHDLGRVYKVDQQMVGRTRTYLLSRRDGQGGFQRNPRALDTFGRAPDDITNAYIVWSLTEAEEKEDFTKELNKLTEQARTSKDPYFLALVANALLNRDRSDREGGNLLRSLASAQKPDGHLDAEKTSITGSGGRDLQIETTALGVLAWLKLNQGADFQANLKKAIQWLGQQRGGFGGFGSTQSTILALKAIIAFAKANKRTVEAGDLKLFVGEQKVGEKHFAAGADEPLVVKLDDAEKLLKAGANDLRVEVTGDKNVFPYTLSWSYQTLKPDSAEGTPVRLQTKLNRAEAAEGETVQLTIDVTNPNDKGQGMTVAIVGLPSGLTLPEDMKQLKDLARLRNDGKDPGVISAWETRGRELILYWRDLAPNQKIEVPLDLICRVPGEYQGPASRAYLYYNADKKDWVTPLKVKITPKT